MPRKYLIGVGVVVILTLGLRGFGSVYFRQYSWLVGCPSNSWLVDLGRRFSGYEVLPNCPPTINYPTKDEAMHTGLNNPEALTKEKPVNICEAVFSGSNVAYVDSLGLDFPLTCDRVIRSGQAPLRFIIQADGTVLIGRDGQITFRVASDETGERLAWAEGIYLQDVTYDGYADLIFLNVAGAYNSSYDFYAYNPKTQTFDHERLLTATNYSFNDVARTITSYYKGRGVGDIYTAETYLFENGKYGLIKTVVQDIVSEADANIENDIYERVTMERRNGRMVEIERLHGFLTELTP